MSSSKSSAPWFYEGQLDTAGVPHGRGALYRDNSITIGEFNSGKVTGEVNTFMVRDGSGEVGHFKGTLRDGQPLQGKYQNEFLLYEGGYLNSLPHGEGTGKFLTTGDEFKGIYKEGHMHQGIYRFGPKSDVDYFDGELHSESPKNGELHFKNQDIATEFKMVDNELVEARMLYSNKDEYVGAFRKGLRHGQGKYTRYTTGEVYEGEFADGKRHGKGTLTVNGKKAKIVYSHD